MYRGILFYMKLLLIKEVAFKTFHVNRDKYINYYPCNGNVHGSAEISKPKKYILR